MKWLIINTEAFSPAGKGKEPVLTFDDLPWVVRKFLSAFPSPLIVLDESSKIKCRAPTKESKKSARSRLIRLLNGFGERMIATGTLMSKSPVNLLDQYDFLDRGYFPESPYEFAERYCVMMTLKTARGRRVLVSQKVWDEVRDYVKRQYLRCGEYQVPHAKNTMHHKFGIREDLVDHIIQHKKYTPFINQEELERRVARCTMFVRRSDVFDTRHERFVHDPIPRPVEIPAKAKKIAKELVDLGFTDNLALGKAAALELFIRLQDVCNGFEPVKDGDGRVTYRPFAENPKLEEMVELLEEMGDEQVAIFSSRTALLEAICRRLGEEGVSFVCYDGSAKDAEKKMAEGAFERKDARVFVANPSSAAYGLNCLGSCSYLIWMCVDGSVEKEYQARHRLLRGQLTEPKIAYKVYVKDSVEERVWDALRVGKELIEAENRKEKFMFKE